MKCGFLDIWSVGEMTSRRRRPTFTERDVHLAMAVVLIAIVVGRTAAIDAWFLGMGAKLIVFLTLAALAAFIFWLFTKLGL